MGCLVASHRTEGLFLLAIYIPDARVPGMHFVGCSPPEVSNS